MELRSVTILFIEDGLDATQKEMQCLIKNGYNVIHLNTGEKAIESLRSNPDKADLILIDINPKAENSAFETADEILKYNDIPILFLLSDPGSEIIKKAEAVNVYGYIIKGHSEELLIVSIRTALRLHKKKRDLQESDRNYRVLIDNMGEGIGFVDQDETFVFANRMGEEIFGVGPGELIFRNLWEFCDIKEFKKLRSEAPQRLKGYKSTFETVIKLNNGQKKTLLVTATPRFSQSGKFQGTFGIFRDVTELHESVERLRESEQKLNDMAKNVPGVIHQFCIREDGARYYSYMSEKAAELFNLTTEHKDPEWKLISLIPEEDHEKFRTSVEKAISSCSPWEYEGRLILKDGKVKWFNAKSIPTKKDKEIVYNGIFLDVTERKEAELLQHMYAEELKLSNATKDKFFSILAHDLRGPFSGFMGLSETLVNDLDNFSQDEIRESVTTIHTSSKKVFELLTNLLEWSRLQTDKIQLKSEIINLFLMVCDIQALFHSSATKKSVSIINQISENTLIYADKYSFSTILRNLISNAVKFTPAGGKITISSSESEKFIDIKISDTGIGMSAEALSKAFRIDAGYTTKGTNGEEGTGLGLVLCKELAGKNNWEMKIKSFPGKGTEFTLKLPLALETN